MYQYMHCHMHTIKISWVNKKTMHVKSTNNWKMQFPQLWNIKTKIWPLSFYYTKIVCTGNLRPNAVSYKKNVPTNYL